MDCIATQTHFSRTRCLWFITALFHCPSIEAPIPEAQRNAGACTHSCCPPPALGSDTELFVAAKVLAAALTLFPIKSALTLFPVKLGICARVVLCCWTLPALGNVHRHGEFLTYACLRVVLSWQEERYQGVFTSSTFSDFSLSSSLPRTICNPGFLWFRGGKPRT